MSAIHYIAWKQMLEATLDCIYEKREFHFHGTPQAIKVFKERLSRHYCFHYQLDKELTWPANLCM